MKNIAIPILLKSKFYIRIYKSDFMSYKQVDGYEWKGVGLGVHPYKEREKHLWAITHIESGKCLLNKINGFDHALDYLLCLRGISPYWVKSETYLKEDKTEWEKLRQSIAIIQHYISSQGERL